MRVTDLLRTIDLFELLSSEELDQLARRLKERHLQSGETLCRQGEPVEAMFAVASGSVELSSAESPAAQPKSRRLGVGDFFGEIALLSGEAHSATATVVSDSRVLVLERDDFEALITTRPQIMRNMLAAISRRAAQANRELLTEQHTAAWGANSPSGHVYPVFSPRGGAGKTTLAINLAVGLAELIPGRVGLLDLDLLFDDAALLLNLSPTTSLASIPEQDLERLDPRILSGLLVDHDSGLRVMVGATRPEDGERITAAHVRTALAAMRRQFLVTVVDCGGGLGEPTLAALGAGDRVFIVCTPELTTLRDVRDCQRFLGQTLQLDKAKLAYVFNHPLPAVGLSRLQFESALEQSMAVEIPHAGESAAKTAVQAGTVVRGSGGSPFAKAIGGLVQELRPSEVATSRAGPNRLFQRLRGNHGR